MSSSNQTNIADCLAAATTQLSGRAAPRLDAEVLLAHILGKTRSHLHAWPDQRLSDAQQQRYLELIARRAAGEPVAYLTGEREFWSLPLVVNRHTLIPRADTECLVELALARHRYRSFPRRARGRASQRPAPATPQHRVPRGRRCGAVARRASRPDLLQPALCRRGRSAPRQWRFASRAAQRPGGGADRAGSVDRDRARRAGGAAEWRLATAGTRL